jgi:hypothetical protein
LREYICTVYCEIKFYKFEKFRFLTNLQKGCKLLDFAVTLKYLTKYSILKKYQSKVSLLEIDKITVQKFRVERMFY